MPDNAARANLIATVRKVSGVLSEYYSIELATKAKRDRREPGRKEKVAAEEAIALAVARHFRRQKLLIRDKLSTGFWNRKATAPPIYLDDLMVGDDDFLAELLRILTNAAKHGIRLFAESTPLQIDWSLTNSKAADWAHQYAYDLIKGIDQTTRDLTADAITRFVQTPGMTIGDVMNALPFGESRASMIATTEITRAYAEGNQQAGLDLQAEYPGVRVVKMWFTNNDDLVCPICGPLDGKQVELRAEFAPGLNNPPAHPNCRCWNTTTTALAEL